MPALTSAAADDWLRSALTWRWLSGAGVSTTGRAWLGLLSSRPVAQEPPRRPPHPQTNLMWKPGRVITPHAALRPPVFPPLLPFLGPNGLGDGLHFAPQKRSVFFNTAGYSICEGLASEVLWISITTEVPLVSMILPSRGEMHSWPVWCLQGSVIPPH